MLSKLTEILAYLETNLDEAHLKKVEQRYKDAIELKSEKPPLILGYLDSGFEAYPYPQVHNDMEKMLYNQLCACMGAAQVKDDSLPMVRANYGVGTVPSLFGLTSRLVGNAMPWVDHCEGIDKIKEIVDKGVPDLDAGFGKKVGQTHAFYREVFSKYPNCERCIKIFHPDLQGAFDIAHLMWGPDIYYALYDEEELVHELLELITQTYIKICEKFKTQINDTTDDGYIYHWSTLYPGKVLLRNDSAVNLSSDMLLEFIRPYDEKILAHFGSGSVHFCGRADQWVNEMFKTKNLKALNFGHVWSMQFGQEYLDLLDTKLEKKLPIINYVLRKQEFERFDFSRHNKGLTIAVGMDSKQAAIEQIRKYYNE